MYSIPVKKLVKEFRLKNEIEEISLDGIKITNFALNRPALQLAGFFDLDTEGNEPAEGAADATDTVNTVNTVRKRGGGD